MSALSHEVQNQLPVLEQYLVIHTEAEYDARVERLNRLLDEVGDNPDHPLYRVIETLALVIEAYDDRHHALPEASDVETLEFLMEQHGLGQSDLPELGSQGVVADILRGHREINADQARALGRRFGVSPEVFL
jgi:HTH-type transcriptional regulator/antitoxin HigA